MDEYPQLYETAFRFEDGTPAFVPSPYDKSTVDVHFRWMQEYGLDGVFLQRFIAEIANPSGKKHFNKVMASAMECANKYDRAVAIMYDLSGMPANGPDILLKDIDALAKAHHLFDHEANPSYLYQNGKPLVTVWGVGFNDNRSRAAARTSSSPAWWSPSPAPSWTSSRACSPPSPPRRPT